jgi:hypothetical protein
MLSFATIAIQFVTRNARRWEQLGALVRIRLVCVIPFRLAFILGITCFSNIGLLNLILHSCAFHAQTASYLDDFTLPG